MSSRAQQSIEFDRVADLYDTYVRADFDIPFWLSQATSIPGKVLELACGTGRVSIPLLEAGVSLSCVDYAPEMLVQLQKKLREKGLSCPTYCQDMVELNLPDRFDLIFIPFHSFSEITDNQRHRLALKQIHSHLTGNGTFICTIQNPVVRTSAMDGVMRLIGEFPLPNGGTLVVTTRMLFDPSTHIASGEQVYERMSLKNVRLDRRTLGINFYLFDKDEFVSLVAESGFSIEALYGDYDQRPFDDASSPFMIWKLRKSAIDRVTHWANPSMTKERNGE